jgi:6-pyruvoyltetrahydropterin 2'-reductase
MRRGDSIYLVESFYSFQGEGRYVGRPSIFLRFGGCNLNCAGFGVKVKKDGATLVGCDSIRAVNKNYFKESWQEVFSPQTLIDKIDSYLSNLSFKPDIVITGGEPLLNYNNPIFTSTIEYFLNLDFQITIETNATISIDFDRYPFYKDVVFAMSVKLKNSGESEQKRVNYQAIKAISQNTKNSFFKFVLDRDSLVDNEIDKITKGFDIPIYCMPLGSSAKELSCHDREVAQFCIDNGYNYIDRLHIRLWDNKEGR